MNLHWLSKDGPCGSEWFRTPEGGFSMEGYTLDVWTAAGIEIIHIDRLGLVAHKLLNSDLDFVSIGDPWVKVRRALEQRGLRWAGSKS